MNMKQDTTNHPDPLMGALRRVVICAGTGCVANGAMKVHAALQERIRARNLPFVLELRDEDDNTGKTALTRSGCQGFCQSQDYSGTSRGVVDCVAKWWWLRCRRPSHGKD